jgi:polysaccharide deacetylase family protein (PEP-CTERM system associated)
MRNALSIDVEDWHHCMVPDYKTWSSYEDRIVYSTTKVLGLLRETGTRATFFLLGYVAASHPELVSQIRAEGHEVASHGYHHEFIYNQTRDEFRADLDRSIQVLEEITGERPLGYRAPFFSIINRSWWAFEVLAEMGFQYDSSIYPVLNHRYGIPNAPRFAHRIEVNGHALLTELPISTLRLGLNLPVGGGVYFRFLPYPLIKMAVKRINRQGRPALLYFHPWEIDPDQPVLDDLPRLFKARRYLNLDKAEGRWRSLLSGFQFAPLREVFQREIEGEATA